MKKIYFHTLHCLDGCYCNIFTCCGSCDCSKFKNFKNLCICLAKIHIHVMNFALIANFIVLCNYQLFVEYQKNWLRRYTGNCCSSLEYLKIFVIINIFNVHGVTQKCESKAQVYADSFKMLNYFSMFLLNVNVFMVSKADDDS